MMYLVGLVCGQELPAGGGEATMMDSMTGHGEKGVYILAYCLGDDPVEGVVVVVDQATTRATYQSRH
jgi:hypothetical protein